MLETKPLFMGCGPFRLTVYMIQLSTDMGRKVGLVRGRSDRIRGIRLKVFPVEAYQGRASLVWVVISTCEASFYV